MTRCQVVRALAICFGWVPLAGLPGCCGDSMPAAPPSLSVERYRPQIDAAARANSQGSPTATFLGVRTTRRGLYLDVLVDAGGQSMSSAYELGHRFQDRAPAGCVDVQGSNGRPVALVQARLDLRDYHPFLSLFAEAPGGVIPPSYQTRVAPGRWAVVQVLVVGTRDDLDPGDYTARLNPEFVGRQLTLTSPDPVHFRVR